MNPFKFLFPKKVLGIDIGTSSIKVVEISGNNGKKTLVNYCQTVSDNSQSNAENSSVQALSAFTPQIIKEILKESGIKTKEAVFAIPDFSTFCTSFEIPPMTEKEIPDAIRYNASQYITLPISEVTLDWVVTPKSTGLDARFIRGAKNPVIDKNSSFKVFLVAVPNQVVQEYKDIAKSAGLKLYAIEAESLALTRALAKNSLVMQAGQLVPSFKKTICLIDIGVKSSVINVIDQGFLRNSYSFNFDSSKLSKAISSTLGVQGVVAEDIKNKEGLTHSKPEVVENLSLLLSPLLNEIKNISDEFLRLEQKQIDQIYLTGGAANMPGLKEHVAEVLKKEVYVPNCFSEFSYPANLQETLKSMSPSFSVAVGTALSRFEPEK